MITKKGQHRLFTEERSNGGKGSITLEHLLEEPAFCGNGKLFAKVTVSPGSSVGTHPHSDDIESYYILKGTARYMDNGRERILHAGDVTYTPMGECHSIENIGEENLEFIALIVTG